MLAAALQSEVDACIAAFTDERDEAGRRLIVRNGYHQPREVLTSAGAVEVARAAGQRPPGRSRHRAAAAVLLNDSARLVTTHSEDHRSAAAAVPARALDQRPRPGARAVPGLLGRAARTGDHEGDRVVEGRAARLRRPRLVGCGLRVPVAFVRAGALFEAGKLVERPDKNIQPEAA